MVVGILCLASPALLCWLRYGNLDDGTLERFMFEMSLQDHVVLSGLAMSGLVLIAASVAT